jgi:SAM-dependent methyltransferase
MCTACRSLDTSKIDALGSRLLQIVNDGALTLMISIGHRAGIFDTMANMPPATSHEIAAAAELNERYVREWLGCLLAARLIEHDPEKNTWHLPAEHAALLTRAASPNNFAAFTQYISLLGSVEDKILRCFREGGGVPYSQFTRFHEVMAEDSGQTVVAALSEHILPLIPGLLEKLEAGISVLDLGCGRGIALRKLAALYPKSRFIGIDFSAEAIGWANEQAARENLANLRYEVGDAAQLDYQQSFDFIATFDAIHDQARPDLVLHAIARALKPDGTYLMQDIRASSRPHENVDHPAGVLLYAISTFHCMTVSLAQGGMGLGTMWGRQLAEKMLADAGFKSIRVEQLAHDFQNDYYILRLAA